MSSFIDYSQYIQDALLQMVRSILEKVEKEGLQGEHAFYITFKTGARGVEVPDFLKAAYPDEVTVVLQHQFENLRVAEDFFKVDLSFSGTYYSLIIPFDAILSFADPSEQVIFQFYDRAGGKEEEPVRENISSERFENADVLSKEEKRELFNHESEKVRKEKAAVSLKHAPAELIDFESLKKKKKKL